MCYFEATIASQGEQGCITVGLVGGSFPMHKQPGKEVRGVLKCFLRASFFFEFCPVYFRFVFYDIFSLQYIIFLCSCLLSWFQFKVCYARFRFEYVIQAFFYLLTWFGSRAALSVCC